ncbi:hypothetical protein CPB83DRAFT_862179 [Crepidotus variabilis]|uniref:Sld7 C-terminal domain-containing protein n=1 Tax=Crepidotus variabilis TaxID=179855 RepID=A0A9P6E7M2_9AGAR|nr:hypothetical protein CPB83DRAFT_862179 [Crepidotus variabilis]
MVSTLSSTTTTTNQPEMAQDSILQAGPPKLVLTPAKAIPATPTTHKTTGPPSSLLAPSYRLLYRGAISLPDTLLLLDGLTFFAQLSSSPLKDATLNPNVSASKHKLGLDLLKTPLALALEIMRGRPSLRFIGTVQLKDMSLDTSGDVELDIHPTAILSRIYFENLFCLKPFNYGSSSSMDGTPSRSDVGLQVALGDTDGPETTEIVIFAQQLTSPLSADSRRIRMCVARLLDTPPNVQPTKRLPRPDDPIPRKPPAFFIQNQLKRTASTNARDLKRTASTGSLAPTKRAKLTEGTAATATSTGESVFKVPELPGSKQPAGSSTAKSKGKGKEKDVFGDVREIQGAKDKQKPEEGQVLTVSEGTLEKTNKNVIKRSTVEHLARTKDPTGKLIDKDHSEFKEMYAAIYRGVCFALRAKMRTSTLDLTVADRLVDAHALMYLGGCGGSAQPLVL